MSNTANIKVHKKKNYKLEECCGYIIIKCYGEFNTPYYTILNPETNVHVHSDNLKIARQICKQAKFFLENGFFITRKLDIMNRASKLALRSIPNKRKRK